MKRIDFKSKMEAGDHSNGASPKSPTSKGKLLKTNCTMKKTIFGIAISVLLIVAGAANAQTKEITGMVEDDQGALDAIPFGVTPATCENKSTLITNHAPLMNGQC